MGDLMQSRINEMIEIVMKVAQGDYSVQVGISDNNDDLDSLAMGLNMMIDDIRNGIEREKDFAVAVAVAEKMEIYRLLIETTNTGYIIIDATGAVKDANDEYVKLTGYPHISDIIGRKVVEWTAPHDLEKNMAAVQECAEQGFIRNFEIDYIRKDGVVIPVEINATVVKNPHGDLEILSLCRDISQRKEIERKLIDTTASEIKISDELRTLNHQLKQNEQKLKAANQQLAANELALRASQDALTQKVMDLERFNKFMVGRELAMIELKKKINGLLKESGRPPEYEEI
jgi:PAS domain S-box-containing protein